MLSGTERLHGCDNVMDACVSDFWRWAFSDLRANNIRGVFAEWLVARLLGFEPGTRDTWADYDLITPEKVKLEVKATAYIQTWNPTVPSKRLCFTGLRSQTWSLTQGYSGVSTYNADLYVFCLQTEQDSTRWDALDITQWRFFLLTREDVILRNSNSISLTVLRKIAPELTAEQFKHQAQSQISSISGSKGVPPECPSKV